MMIDEIGCYESLGHRPWIGIRLHCLLGGIAIFKMGLGYIGRFNAWT